MLNMHKGCATAGPVYSKNKKTNQIEVNNKVNLCQPVFSVSCVDIRAKK